MTPRPSPRPSGWFTGRTRLVTVVSIGVVVLAGAAAVSANVGILGAASDSPVGDASLYGDLGVVPTQEPQVIDVYLPAATDTVVPTTSTSPDPRVQQFAVDVAGTVAVAATGSGVRLEQVAPTPGWRWSLTQSDPSTLLVTLSDGVRTLEFTAVLAADGSIAATVDEPIVAAAPAAPAAGSNASGGEPEEDDEHEEHEQYEGGEDDD